MSEQETLSVRLTIYPDDCDEKALRQVGFGIQPLMLIEPDVDEETEDVSFHVTLSLIDRSGAADILDLVVEALRQGGDAEGDGE